MPWKRIQKLFLIDKLNTVNLAAADVKKEGARFDLPMAVGILTALDLISEKALIEFCRGKLAPYKTPKKIHFLESLPRDTYGKVLLVEFSTIFLAANFPHSDLQKLFFEIKER